MNTDYDMYFFTFATYSNNFNQCYLIFIGLHKIGKIYVYNK
jgi:hypothetical protein